MARQVLEIEAQVRKTGKKSDLRRIRKEGNLPATLYGRHMDAPLSITASEKVLQTIYKAPSKHMALLNMSVDGKTHTCMLQAIGRDPVTGKPLHLDFKTISLKEKAKFNVPVVLENTEAATKMDLILQVLEENVEIESLPLDCPMTLPLDVSKYAEDGTVVHVRDIELPGDIRLLTEGDRPVLVVQAPRVQASAGAAGEGEDADAKG